MGFGDGEKLRRPSACAPRSPTWASPTSIACHRHRDRRDQRAHAHDARQGSASSASSASCRRQGRRRTDLGEALKTFVAQHKRRGLAVLLSDLYDPAGFEKGINALRYNRFEPFVLHLVDPPTRTPQLAGDVRVYDCETGDEREVTVTARAREATRRPMTRTRPACSASASKPGELLAPTWRSRSTSSSCACSAAGASCAIARDMHFVGVPLHSCCMVGALAGAAIVVFYILKLKRRPVAVPFSKIWERILRDKEATSLFSQLKRLLSLLLQLALLALLLLALGDPRTACQALDRGPHVVVLIDASASMKPPTSRRPGSRPAEQVAASCAGSGRAIAC
jgi:hypothetical protein